MSGQNILKLGSRNREVTVKRTRIRDKLESGAEQQEMESEVQPRNRAKIQNLTLPLSSQDVFFSQILTWYQPNDQKILLGAILFSSQGSMTAGHCTVVVDKDSHIVIFFFSSVEIPGCENFNTHISFYYTPILDGKL